MINGKQLTVNICICNLPFTAVSLFFDLPRHLRSNNGGKKVANTTVNGKLPLAVRNPRYYTDEMNILQN